MRCDQKVSGLYFSLSYNLHLPSVPYCAFQSSFLASWYSVIIGCTTVGSICEILCLELYKFKLWVFWNLFRFFANLSIKKKKLLQVVRFGELRRSRPTVKLSLAINFCTYTGGAFLRWVNQTPLCHFLCRFCCNSSCRHLPL